MDRTDRSLNAEVARIKAILAYELSGQRSFEACDIPTRERIVRLVAKILHLRHKPGPV